MDSSPFAPDEPMAELHAHLGGSVPTYVMWESAHAQGIALPTRDYWEFDRMVSISDPRGVDGLDALDKVYHVTELIQSSPLAVERCVHGMIGGGYRSQRITTCEVRFNPMKRNRGGERDLDHIILAAGDPELIALLASTGIVLEVCPTSNLLTGALADAGEVRAVFRTFLEAGVRVTVSTDGPEMMRTHLRDEFAFLCSIGAMSADEARAANALAHEVSFVATKEVARI
ncbi:MAG TPA: hypothetical protein VK546_04320 [Gaiellales bacterium]|nr:hypothetical protein [Gaiellales bacterium]